MSKHTPGPWYVEFGEAYNVRADHGGIVAQIHNLKGRHGIGGRIDANEASSNARLIAAAPDLLEALQRSLNWLASYPGGNAEGCYDQARAAIDKATGAQP